MYIEVVTQGRETSNLNVDIAGAQWLQRHNADLHAREMQMFVFFQFTLRWISIGIWIVFAALAYKHSFELHNLHLATALSAVFLAAAVAIMLTLIHLVIRVAQAQQHW